MTDPVEEYLGPELPKPGEDNSQKDYFAPGRPTAYPYGVLYQGEWETPFDGSAVAVRKHATALAAAGIPVLLKSFSNVVINNHGVPEPVPTVGVPPEVKKEIQGLNLTSIGATIPMIKHAVVGDAAHLSRLIMRGIAGPADDVEIRVGAQQAAYASTILYSVWERDQISQELADHLASIGECWVPCEHNRQLLLSAGVERVRVVPHPFDHAEDICKLTRRRPHLNDIRRFYAIGAWQPRKGFHELVGAFMKAFKPDKGRFLTIKFSGGKWPGYPSPAESLALWMQNPEVLANGWTSKNLGQHLQLLEGRVPRSRIIELHFRNNIYVCSSRGEAWCLPAFDAKLAGNRLVHVPYGGTADFAEDSDIMVPFTMAPVPTSYNWETGAQWADFAVDALADALKRAKPPDEFQFPVGYDQRFSKRAVGALMKQAIIEFTEKLHPPAAEYYRDWD